MKYFFYKLIVGNFEALLYFFFILLKDLGIAILVFSIIFRLIILPLSFIQLTEENKLRKIKKRLDEELKNTKDLLKKTKVINNIYKEEKFNPLKNISLQILSIPIYFGAVIAIFNVLKKVSNPYFFAKINLSKPYLPLGIVVIFLNFYYALKQSTELRGLLLFILCLISIIILTIPSALLLYFLINLLSTMLERKIFDRYLIKFIIKPIQKNNT